MTEVTTVCAAAQEAAFELAQSSGAGRNAALMALAAALRRERAQILEVNAAEVADAVRSGRLSAALCDRLKLTEARFAEMVAGVESVASLPDPVGRISGGRVLPSGLRLIKRSVPFGVIGVIYEARPNVTIDIAALCLKSANACVLRGGSEALKTNTLLYSVLKKAMESCHLPAAAVGFIASAKRESVAELLQQDEYVDLLIPRGGEELQRRCRREARMPVITGGFGISHIFVDESCEVARAVPLIINAKVQKPSACNALDTLLVHEKVAGALFKLLLPELEKFKVRLFAHGAAYARCGDYPYLEKGSDEDFKREFLSLAMNVAEVADVKQAAAHLRRVGANHSDAILTDSRAHADYFCHRAGSACVYVNASTRFTDGGQFGLGAEVAISTQKLHARGPLALEELTTYQYVGEGDYLARA